MRLIDADEILKKCNGGNCWYIPRDAIEDAPTIDAETVKHGEWKYYHYKDINNVYVGVCECSVCKHRGYSGYKYCPNCGAKMDNGAQRRR